MSIQKVNVDYTTKEFFKGRDREYSRYELKKLWVELPQNARNIDAIYNISGVAKYHLKELMKIDEWKEEANKEDSFRMLAKRKEQELMSEETRQKYIEARFEMDSKMFKVAQEILNSEDFADKIRTVAQETTDLKGLKDLYGLVNQMITNYKATIGIQDAPKVANLTQVNNYDLRDSVRQELMSDIIVEAEYED